MSSSIAPFELYLSPFVAIVATEGTEISCESHDRDEAEMHSVSLNRGFTTGGDGTEARTLHSRIEYATPIDPRRVRVEVYPHFNTSIRSRLAARLAARLSAARFHCGS